MKLSQRLLNSLMNKTMELENWTIEQLTGYKPVTTFYLDFSIADKFGIEAIQDTYNRAFEEWKNNYIYLTELSMVLNWKIWRWFEFNEDYARLYDKLWKEVDTYCVEHLNGAELEYYFETTD